MLIINYHLISHLFFSQIDNDDMGIDTTDGSSDSGSDSRSELNAEEMEAVEHNRKYNHHHQIKLSKIKNQKSSKLQSTSSRII